MAQTNYTPIQLYYSSTASAVPVNTNLASGELAINITDGILFYKDNAGTVQKIGYKLTPTNAGGTGLTSFTANGVVYASSTSALSTSSALTFDGSRLAIGTATSNIQLTTTVNTNQAYISLADADGRTAVFRGPNSGSPNAAQIGTTTNHDTIFLFGGTEGMRLTSTGLNTQKDAIIYGVTVGRGAGALASNTAVGASALAANTSGAVNGAFGYQSLGSNTTGYDNNAFGYQALYANISGIENAGFGHYALKSNTTGGNNTGIGSQSLYSNTTASNNTAVGYQAAYASTTAVGTTAVGYQAGVSATTGVVNAFGYRALASNTTASSNSAFGQQALTSNTTGDSNTAMGLQAAYSNTTGSNNTAVGYQAGYSNTAGNGIFIGFQAGYNNVSGFGNLAIGIRALGYAGAGVTGGANNAIGDNALYSLTSGIANTAFGTQALYSNTTASSNTAVGYQAGYSNTTGTPITAFGYQAAYAGTTADWSTAFGYQALKNTTGTQNSAFGRALVTNTSGASNSAFGMNSLYYNTTGSYNTAYGQESLFNNTTASYNTAVGYQAGYSYSGSDGYNTLFGWKAGFALTTGYTNTIIGANAGVAATTSTYSTFVGVGSGNAITTGSKNTILGGYTGNQGGLDIRTASNYIVLSDGDGNPRLWHSGSFLACPTVYSVTTASIPNVFVDSAGGIYRGGVSALKYKQDIRDLEEIDISLIRAVRYKSKCEIDDKTKDYFGVVADQVAEAGIEELVTRNADGEVEGFQYERLTVVLLKAIQELKAEVDSLKSQLNGA